MPFVLLLLHFCVRPVTFCHRPDPCHHQVGATLANARLSDTLRPLRTGGGYSPNFFWLLCPQKHFFLVLNSGAIAKKSGQIFWRGACHTRPQEYLPNLPLCYAFSRRMICAAVGEFLTPPPPAGGSSRSAPFLPSQLLPAGLRTLLLVGRVEVKFLQLGEAGLDRRKRAVGVKHQIFLNRRSKNGQKGP